MSKNCAKHRGHNSSFDTIPAPMELTHEWEIETNRKEQLNSFHMGKSWDWSKWRKQRDLKGGAKTDTFTTTDGLTVLLETGSWTY